VKPSSRLVDFTKGDKPEAEAYSLRFAGASGIPNGIEEKGGPIAASRQADKRG